MDFRDYTYLDTGRLQNYMSSLDSGMVEELTEITRSQSEKEGRGGIRAHVIEAGGRGSSQEESTQQRSMRVTAQHMFGRLYDALEKEKAIKVFEEDETLSLEEVHRREVVEITRSFEPSPMNELISNLFQLMETMRGFGFVEEVNDPEMQEAVQGLAMIFRGEEGREEVPMVAQTGEGEGSSSVVFVAKSQFLLVDQNDFQGDMTVFGRVSKLIPEGKSLDLFDFLKVPRSLAKDETIKKEILAMFETWPDELGGPVSRDKLQVAGPIAVVTPVAVYEA